MSKKDQWDRLRPRTADPQDPVVYIPERLLRRLRIGLPLVLIADLLAQVVAFNRALDSAFAYYPGCGYVKGDCAAYHRLTTFGLFLLGACVVAFILTMAAASAARAFFRTYQRRDSTRATLFAAVGLLVPVLGLLVAIVFLPPLPD